MARSPSASAPLQQAATTTTGGTAVGAFISGADTIVMRNTTMGSIDAVGTTSTVSGGITGIDGAGTGPRTIENNTIGNPDVDNMRTGYTLSGANLSNAGTLTSTSGATATFVGVRSSSTGASTSMSNNTLRGWVTSSTVQAVTGITNTGAVTGTMTLNSNALGTATRDWIRYAFANSGTLSGVSNSAGAT